MRCSLDTAMRYSSRAMDADGRKIIMKQKWTNDMTIQRNETTKKMYGSIHTVCMLTFINYTIYAPIRLHKRRLLSQIRIYLNT
jgi:hypothetical protein